MVDSISHLRLSLNRNPLISGNDRRVRVLEQADQVPEDGRCADPDVPRPRASADAGTNALCPLPSLGFFHYIFPNSALISALLATTDGAARIFCLPPYATA